MKPQFSISANENNVTTALAPRLLSLRVIDEAGMRSDEVAIRLDNRAPRVKLPGKGTELEVRLGYANGAWSPRWLYTIDELELSGPPDTLTIRARAADMGSKMKAPRTRSWHGVTLGDLVTTIAAEHDFAANVAPELASVVIPHLDQTAESDLHLLTRIAKDRGAVFKPWAGRFVLFPGGRGRNPSGQAFPPLTIKRTSVLTWRWRAPDRGRYGAVETHWHDLDAAERKAERAGTGTPVYTMRHTYPNAEAARAAARAKYETLLRGRDTLELEVIGQPRAFAEARVTVAGLHPAVDTDWIATRVEHTLDGNGYRTGIEAEAPKP